MDASKLLALIEPLCARLCEDTPNARALAAGIGGTIEDQGVGFAVVVHPKGPAIRLARVVRAGLGEIPAYIELTLADPVAVSLSDLRAALGEAVAVPRLHPGDTERVLFPAAEHGQAVGCAVLAGLTPAETNDERYVCAVTLRRDVRT